MVERIIGVACKHPDGGVYSLMAPARHGQVLRMVEACYRWDDANAAHKVEQGFITDAARYVNRIEARKIATAAGQSSERDKHLNELFSEDLW